MKLVKVQLESMKIMIAACVYLKSLSRGNCHAHTQADKHKQKSYLLMVLYTNNFSWRNSTGVRVMVASTTNTTSMATPHLSVNTVNPHANGHLQSNPSSGLVKFKNVFSVPLYVMEIFVMFARTNLYSQTKPI